MFPRRIAAIAAVTIALGGAVGLASSVSFPSQSVAQMSTESPELGRGGWLQDLNLTPQQMQQVKAIRSRYKDQLSQQRQAAQQAQQELKALMVGTATAEQVRQKYSQVKTIRQQLMETRFNSLLEVRDVLTLEQRQKLGDRLGKARSRGRDRVKNRAELQRGSEETENPVNLGFIL